MTPPRLASWLLLRVLDPRAGEAVGGDLSEEFSARGAGPRARAWYWRQVLAAIGWHWRSQWRGRGRGQHPERGRERGRTMTDSLWTETRQTWRALRRSPGYSVGAVAPLALAIALSTSIFAVVHVVLIRDLPFSRPERLVIVGEHKIGSPVGNIGYSTFVDLRERSTSVDGFAAMNGWGPTLTAPSTERLTGLRVTHDFFGILGVQPALGRLFQAADDTPATRRVVILSDALWRRQFGADPSVIDRVIRLNETDYRVIGVLPRDFEPVVSSTLYNPAEIWSPLGYQVGGDSSCRSCRHLRALASLRPGVSQDAAQDELRSLHTALTKQFPADYGDGALSLDALAERIARPMATPLSVLMAAVLLVLVIAGANASSLTIARAADRGAEVALRTALGASRVQIARQRAIEALLLASVAGLAGVAGAQFLIAWLVRQAPDGLPRVQHIGLNGDVLLFAGATVLVTAAIIAILPVFQGLRGQGLLGASNAASMRARATDSRTLVRAREFLVVADVAIALMLAIGAGTMIRSVDRLLAVEPGFDPTNVQTLNMSLVGPRWAEDSAVRVFQRDVLEAVRATPGVDAAALAGQVPLGGNYDKRGGFLEERYTKRAQDEIDFERYSVTPGYLSLMGIPLLRGRDLVEADREGMPRVMLVNEWAARQFWPNQEAIGRRVTFDDAKSFVTVVGIVGDVRHYGLDAAPDPQMYMPQAQMTDSFLVLTVKTTGFDAVLPQIRDAVRRFGPDVPVYGVQPMSALVETSAAPRRFTATLLAVFAVVAVLMTTAGVYGLVAYTVSRRTREFGIRIALGSPAAGIRRLVLARGGLLTLLGAGVGLACALPLTRVLGDQLYETSPLEAGVVAAGLVVLIITSALAHAVPVARATRVSPTVALRGE